MARAKKTDTPAPEPTPEVPENFKPRTAEDLTLALKTGYAVRVALKPSHEAQLDQTDRHGFKVRDKIVSDAKGPIMLYLPHEPKYAWVIRCQAEGCDDIRVVRTSDIAGGGPGLAYCVAHSGKGGKAKGKAVPLGDGGLDVSALQPETTPDEEPTSDES